MIMNNIFSQNLKYYGYNDFSGQFFVKSVCENLDYLENNYEILIANLSSLEDLYFHIWVFAFQDMVKDINQYDLQDNYKNRIILLSDRLIPKHKEIIAFFNKRYVEIFNKNNHSNLYWHNFFESAVALIYGQYRKNIDPKVFSYLEENCFSLLLDNFTLCANYYKNNKESFRKLFLPLHKSKDFNDQVYVRFLENYKHKNDDFLKQEASFICERALPVLINSSNISDINNLVEVISLAKDYERLAHIYKLSCANEYLRLSKKTEKALGDCVKKEGICKKIGSVNLGESINLLKSISSEYKFIYLTHNDLNSKYENNLDYILFTNNKENPLSEFFNGPFGRQSKKYPRYRQELMELNFFTILNFTNLVIFDERLGKEFSDYLYNICLQIQSDYFNSTINIEEQVTGILDMFFMMNELYKTNQFLSTVGKSLVHSTSLSICSAIEKILRNIVIKEINGKEFIDARNIKLSDFFKGQFKIQDLSEGLKYHLEYYLIKEVNYDGLTMDKPGLNIRNRLMHGDDDVFEEINYETCLILFFMLVSMLNDLLITLDK